MNVSRLKSTAAPVDLDINEGSGCGLDTMNDLTEQISQQRSASVEGMLQWFKGNVPDIHLGNANNYANSFFYRRKVCTMEQVSEEINRDSNWLLNLEVDEDMLKRL